MIITKTPFRISFFGGGTDYPDWYNTNGGSAISAAINKYCYVSIRYLPPFFDYKYRIRYFKNELCASLKDIRHPTVRESLRYLKFYKNGIEILHNADLPALSGLGSSSTFTVGLMNGLYSLMNKKIGKMRLAKEAILIEQQFVKDYVGSQDQVAASFGGLNHIAFDKKKIEVKNIFINKDYENKFKKNFFLIFSGFQRKANLITKRQVERTKNKKNYLYLNKIQEITKNAYVEIFNQKKLDIRKFADAFNEQWDIKKKLTNNVTNQNLDNIYSEAIKNGALGGKLLGAGGGGFFLFIVDDKNIKKFQKKFRNLLHVPFDIDKTGSTIIHNSER